MTPHVRQAEPADIPAAVAVLHASIRALVDDHHDDPRILDPWLLNKTPETLERWMAHPDSFFAVVEAPSIVGVASIRRSGDLDLCYVVPSAQRAGVGRALLRYVEAHARSWGLNALSLQSTTTALPFYVAHGYTPTGPVVIDPTGLRGHPLSKQL